MPTPRGAGIAIVISVFVGVGLVVLGVQVPTSNAGLVALVLVSLSLATVGFIDDLGGGMSARLRLLIQVSIGSIAAIVVVRPHFAWIPPTMLLGSLMLPGVVNAVNFFDGINGVVAASSVVIGSTYGLFGLWAGIEIVGIAGFALAGAAAGFLPLNYPRARVFMGDVGSYFIGAWIAIMGLIAWSAGIGLWSLALPLFLILGDTGYTLVRRILVGANVMAPHRDHTYQRLVRLGLSHTVVTLIVTLLTVVLAIDGLLIRNGGAATTVIGSLVGCGIVASYLVLPRLFGAFRLAKTGECE